MQRILRYWRTLKHLRWAQIAARVRFRLARPRVNLAPAPPRARATGAWIASVERAQMIHAGRARFIGVERDIASTSAWNDPACEKLWLYNLHYFEDLLAPADATRRREQAALVLRWIRENPAPIGNGWEPYPISLRVCNWIKWSREGGSLDPDAWQSLAVQARWLSRRIEWHLLANHLFVNAKALVFAGLAFEGPEAERWLRQGLAILHKQLPAQILADGGHFERSPMYHALILEDLLDLINAAQTWGGRIDDATIAGWRDAAAGMLAWLRRMTHPDGSVVFFNDAANQIAPTFIALEAYAARLRVASPACAMKPIEWMHESGYARAEIAAAVLFCDLAPVGPDEQPGHAHADTLSCELAIGGHPIIVNSGTSTYAVGAQRALERSTRAHNTLEINGENSSEVWGGFRVGRRARVTKASVVGDGQGVTITGAHDGYAHLSGSPTHVRTWTLRPGSLTIADEVQGRFASAQARIHLHPSVTAGEDGALHLPCGRRMRVEAHGGTLHVERTAWHPSFGTSHDNLCLVLRMEGASGSLVLRW